MKPRMPRNLYQLFEALAELQADGAHIVIESVGFESWYVRVDTGFREVDSWAQDYVALDRTVEQVLERLK